MVKVGNTLKNIMEIKSIGDVSASVDKSSVIAQTIPKCPAWYVAYQSSKKWRQLHNSAGVQLRVDF